MPLVAVLGLTACGATTPEQVATRFCQQYSAGQWRQALTKLNGQRLLDERMATLDAEEKGMIEAVFSRGKCDVRAHTDHSATIAFDVIDVMAVTRSMMGSSLLDLFIGSEPDPDDLMNRLQSSSAPRKTVTETVDFKIEGRTTQISQNGVQRVLAAMTGGMY